MKKTLSITLGGRVFIVEEDGYHALENYLNDLKRHFTTEGTADELMDDIEVGLAEKFSEKLGPQKEAITTDDVQDVIAVMGRADEITQEEETQNNESGSASSSSSEEADVPKRFYRNSDDLIIGGVCSGIAAYLGIDPLIIRIIFVVLSLVNGLGILAYIILWIAMPLAETNAQKLAMRGKPMNVEEIEELVKEKADRLGKEGRHAWERARKPDSAARRILNIPVQIVAVVAQLLRGFFRILGPILSIIIGVCILLGSIAGLAATSVLATLLLFRINEPYLLSDLPLAELASRPMYSVGVVSGTILALVPLVFLTLLAVTMIRRKNSFRPIASGILIAMWIVAAGGGALAASDIGPWAYARVQEIEQETRVTRTFPVETFSGVEATGNSNVRIIQGDVASVTFTGRERDLEALRLVNENGVLRISSEHQRRAMCLFCFARPIEGEIVVPSLTSYSGKGATEAHIEGFRDNISLDLTNVARADIFLQGQHATATLQNAAFLTLAGSSTHLVIDTTEASRVSTDRTFHSTSLNVHAEEISHVKLEGSTAVLIVEVENIASVDADRLQAGTVTVSKESAASYDGPEDIEHTSSTDEGDER